MFFEIFLFVFYTIFCFFSVLGYGILFNKLVFRDKDTNIGELGFFGFLIIFFISIFFHFFTPLLYWINFNILLFGLLISFINIHFIAKQFLYSSKTILVCTAVILTSILINNTHGDHEWYHLMYVNYLNNFKIVFGLVNIQNSLAHGHGWMDIMGLFSLPIVENKGVSIIALLFFYFFILYLLLEIKTTQLKSVKIYSIILIVYCLATFNKLADFGTEIQPSLIILVLIINILKLLHNKNTSELCVRILFYFFYALVLRMGSIIVLPIILVIFILNYKIIFQSIFNHYRLIIFSFLFLIFFISKNFIVSGCLYFPIYNTCFNNEKITWASPIQEARERYEFLKAISHRWHFYIVEEANLERREDYLEPMKKGEILSPIEYNKNKFFWIQHWSKDPDNAKLLNAILILLFCYICFFLFSDRKFKIKDSLYILPKKNNLVHAGMLLSVFMWFYLSPSMRYGGYPIVGGTLTFYISLMLAKNIISKKIFNFVAIFLFFISASYFSSKNIFRIINKLNNNEFVDFPWPNYERKILNKDYKTITINDLNLNLMLTSNDVKNGKNIGPVICGNVDMLCMPAERIVCISNMKKNNGYIFVENKKPECLQQIRENYWQ
tara:strand:- start:359 stop:2188 length:1830 start_codon:yes stop_codon:yes gene_type:complete